MPENTLVSLYRVPQTLLIWPIIQVKCGRFGLLCGFHLEGGRQALIVSHLS